MLNPGFPTHRPKKALRHHIHLIDTMYHFVQQKYNNYSEHSQNKDTTTWLYSHVQSNLNYPDIDYPDFFSGPVFSWILISFILKAFRGKKCLKSGKVCSKQCNTALLLKSACPGLKDRTMLTLFKSCNFAVWWTSPCDLVIRL